MEAIDIGITELEPITLKLSDDKPSVNFGPGVEFLMNDKKRSNSSSNINIDLSELDKLESELNELSGVNPFSKSEKGNYQSSASQQSGGGGDTKTLSGFSNFFNFGGFSKKDASAAASSAGDAASDSKIGEATANGIGSTGSARTWDGFSKTNEIPTNDAFGSSKMTDREKRRKKRLMIKKLDEWYEKGLIKHASHFNIDSNYEEVEDEYETALEDKRRKDSVKLQGWWFMTFVNSIEYGNSLFNPFDLNLDGWGEQVSEDIESYEDIFGELYEKYKGGKLSPEISLLLRLGFSAAVVNITNKALSSATPGFNDVIKQSPELMRMFSNATVQSMSQQDPRASFMSNILNKEPDINTSFGPPPKPVETRPPQSAPQRGAQQQSAGRMQFTENTGNRPDILASRGGAIGAPMFRESGVDINNAQETLNSQQQRIPTRPPQPSQQQQPRQEMRGPQNIDVNNILAGLKTKEVIVPQQQQQQVENIMLGEENDSMISVSSIRDLNNTKMPKRAGGNRRQRSDKNTISLDI
jgi:hypothetical protein